MRSTIHDIVESEAEKYLVLRAPREEYRGGTLRRALTGTYTYRRAGSVRYGLGRISDLGPEREPAPRGTIAAFLRWWRNRMLRIAMQYNAKMEKKERRKRSMGPWPLAWVFLTEEQKRALKDLRLEGNVEMGGDPQRRPRYWVQQEVGMTLVAIKGQRYIADAQQHIRDHVRPSILEAVRSAMRGG
ncbi:MAG: hypothetical protein ACUVS5_11530 [Anaerolineae bacterium]